MSIFFVNIFTSIMVTPVFTQHLWYPLYDCYAVVIFKASTYVNMIVL